MGRPTFQSQTFKLFQFNGLCGSPEDRILHDVTNRISIPIFFCLGVYPELSSSEQYTLEITYEIAWKEFWRASVAHWVIILPTAEANISLNSKHKHPYPELAKSSRHLADVYMSVYSALTTISFRTPLLKEYGYSYGFKWFAGILDEFRLCICCGDSTGKNAFIGDLRKINSSLEDIGNGVSIDGFLNLEQIFHPDQSPCTYKFFQMLTEREKHFSTKTIRQSLLEAITKAMRSYAGWLEKSDMTVVSVFEDKAFSTKGRGRHRQRRDNLKLKLAKNGFG